MYEHAISGAISVHWLLILDAFLGMTSSTSGGRDAHLMEQRLLLCEIEERFIGLNYSFLFMHSVLKQHILPIGLYRSPKKVDPNFKGSSSVPPPNLPYVYTNPHPETTINAGDRVYILKPENITNESSQVHFITMYIEEVVTCVMRQSMVEIQKMEDLSQEVTLDELRTTVEDCNVKCKMYKNIFIRVLNSIFLGFEYYI